VKVKNPVYLKFSGSERQNWGENLGQFDTWSPLCLGESRARAGVALCEDHKDREQGTSDSPELRV